jgi:hypothetical protein
MAIGRDIYNDSRLILKKLEQLYPQAHQVSAPSPDHQILEQLFDHWVNDNGLFSRAAQLIPADAPVMKDPTFVKDRTDFSGRSFSRESILKMRLEALVEFKGAFALLEGSLLADGREWILKTPDLTLADIEGPPSALCSLLHY